MRMIYCAYFCDPWKEYPCNVDITKPIVITTSLKKFKKALLKHFELFSEPKNTIEDVFMRFRTADRIIEQLNLRLPNVLILGFED